MQIKLYYLLHWIKESNTKVLKINFCLYYNQLGVLKIQKHLKTNNALTKIYV